MFKTHNIDVVIPLGNGSKHDNFELRIALRSIAGHVKNCGRVWIISSAPPEWLRNCRLLDVPDQYRHNKDANIINKLLHAANEADLSEDFLFWSDDQAALKTFNAAALPPVYNPRTAENFGSNRVWHRRMRHTFEYFAQRNTPLDRNWESHTPQLINKRRFRDLLRDVDYISEPGYGVNTLYFGLSGAPRGVAQNSVKFTVENAMQLKNLPNDKLFIGYNDNAFDGNLPQLLLERFPEPASWEQK